MHSWSWVWFTPVWHSRALSSSRQSSRTRAVQSSMEENFLSPPMLLQRDSRAQRASAIDSVADAPSVAAGTASAVSAGRDLLLQPAMRAINPTENAVLSAMFTLPPLLARVVLIRGRALVPGTSCIRRSKLSQTATEKPNDRRFGVIEAPTPRVAEQGTRQVGPTNHPAPVSPAVAISDTRAG
jgi:hypothetical protein